MAGLVDSVVPAALDTKELVGLYSNPVFVDLQQTLAQDCTHINIPYSLLISEPATREKVPDKDDLMVEDAALQAEFRQLAPLEEPRVKELEKFYQTQSAAIVTQRMDAISRLQSSPLLEEYIHHEMSLVHDYYNQQQLHLTVRISKSLQLLKTTLPNGLPPGGLTKKTTNKSRLLNTGAVAIMTRWFQGHIDNPYPTDAEKQQMADEGEITVTQVKAWFANKRNRTLNTKPKRQQMALKSQLASLCEKLGASEPKAQGRFNNILGELSGLVNVVQKRTPLAMHVGQKINVPTLHQGHGLPVS